MLPGGPAVIMPGGVALTYRIAASAKSQFKKSLFLGVVSGWVCVSYFTAFILKIKCNLILSGEKKKSEKKYVRMLERNKLYIFPLLRSVFCVSIYTVSYTHLTLPTS